MGKLFGLSFKTTNAVPWVFKGLKGQLSPCCPVPWKQQMASINLVNVDCDGLKCIPPSSPYYSNSFIEVFFPSTLECDLIWKQSLCGCDPLRYGHVGAGQSLRPGTGVFIWGPRDTHRHKRKTHMWRQTQRLEWCRDNPRNTKDWRDQQRLGRGKASFILRAVGGSTALRTPDLWLLASRTATESVSVVWSYPVSGTF